NNSCSQSTTSTTIASNKTNQTFWYQDGSDGHPRITASASYEGGPTLSASQIEAIGTAPAPTMTSISPTSKTVGDASFTMTVNGTNFFPDSVVRLNGSDRTTTYVSGTRLTASIPASDLTAAGTFNMTVFTPTPGGGTSNAQTFTVNAACTAPSITTQPTPQSITYGSNASFTAAASGSPT